MKIEHVFKSECYSAEELFDDCFSLDTYLANLEKQAPLVKTANYVKHGFEALIEAIILCEKGSMRIKNYSPVPSCNNDLFVNGVGEKSSGKKIGVMVCLVEDIDIPLTSNANHLTTFTSNAVEHYKVAVDEAKGFRIFTNAKSLHPNTLEQFFNDKSVVFYLKSDIEKMITGNEKFWDKFEKAMKGKEKETGEKAISRENLKDGGIKLRPFQVEASQSILDNAKGQIILPTGTGKTVVAMSAIYKEIENYERNQFYS
jgi:superfamily II RNA helicase